MKLLALVLVCCTIAGIPVALADPPETPPDYLVQTPAPFVVESTYQGHTAAWWAQRSRGWHARALSLHRTLLHNPTVTDAINLACVTYGYCSTLWRKARCESHLYRFARNPSGASGLFQFLPSTWSSTPFGSFSIFDPFANALAAGWMHQQGRGGEWVCR